MWPRVRGCLGQVLSQEENNWRSTRLHKLLYVRSSDSFEGNKVAVCTQGKVVYVLE